MIFFLRLVQTLSLTFWIGAMVFFSLFVAPSAFAALPSRHLAGTLVSLVLTRLHQLGIVAGVLYLVSGIALSTVAPAAPRVLCGRHLLVVLMLALTIASQWFVSPRMVALRTDMVNVDATPADSPLRIEFNRLHRWSVRLEAGILLLGLATLFVHLKKP